MTPEKMEKVNNALYALATKAIKERQYVVYRPLGLMVAKGECPEELESILSDAYECFDTEQYKKLGDYLVELLDDFECDYCDHSEWSLNYGE